jgi:hypothetical protein
MHWLQLILLRGAYKSLSETFEAHHDGRHRQGGTPMPGVSNLQRPELRKWVN